MPFTWGALLTEAGYWSNRTAVTQLSSATAVMSQEIPLYACGQKQCVVSCWRNRSHTATARSETWEMKWRHTLIRMLWATSNLQVSQSFGLVMLCLTSLDLSLITIHTSHRSCILLSWLLLDSNLKQSFHHLINCFRSLPKRTWKQT